MTMKQYPNGWRWTNGLAQEKARILLPLAWPELGNEGDAELVW